MEIILATLNLHKMREFKQIFKAFPQIELLSLNDFQGYIPPEEEGKTFEENALLKATHAAKALGKWAIADDSGLVVPALQGAPGVYSARYAGPKATDLDNRKKLLKEMAGKSDLERAAYFECVIALSNPQGEARSVSGICEGLITAEERGRGGFGYDSLFIKHDYSHTFAELEESIKNRISHRRKAIDKLMLLLDCTLQRSEPL